MWRSEAEVLAYLNEKYKARFGVDSITQFVARDPRAVYRRLVTIQGGSQDPGEAQTYAKIAKLEPKPLEDCRKRLAVALRDHVKAIVGREIPVGEDDDVLFDIPRRELNISGSIYMAMDDGEVRGISEISAPVAQVTGDFVKLAHRIRVYVHPRIAQAIGDRALVTDRPNLLKMVEKACPTGTVDQVK